MQEFCANASVSTDRGRHPLNIRPHGLAQICDLVDECNLEPVCCDFAVFEKGPEQKAPALEQNGFVRGAQR